MPRRIFEYADQSLPIGEGQTISQPYMVAAMTEALVLPGGETVLEIGTGSGYAAAVLAHIARNVWRPRRRIGEAKAYVWCRGHCLIWIENAAGLHTLTRKL